MKKFILLSFLLFSQYSYSISFDNVYNPNNIIFNEKYKDRNVIYKEIQDLGDYTTYGLPLYENYDPTNTPLLLSIPEIPVVLFSPRIFQIKCNNTTEVGDDEIFLQIIYRATDGSYITTYSPSSGHVSFNDNGTKGYSYGWPTWRDRFYPGKYAAMLINVFEVDNTKFSLYSSIAQTILAACGEPKCVAGQKTLETLDRMGFDFMVNQNDYLGSFSIEYGFNPDGRTLWKNCTGLDYCKGEAWGLGYHLRISKPVSPNTPEYTEYDYEFWIYLEN